MSDLLHTAMRALDEALDENARLRQTVRGLTEALSIALQAAVSDVNDMDRNNQPSNPDVGMDFPLSTVSDTELAHRVEKMKGPHDT